MEKLDNLIDKIIKQKQTMCKLTGEIYKPRNRGYVIWECVFQQYQANIRYIEYLKKLK